MDNLRELATRICANLRRNGLNGIRFHKAYVEDVNTLEDFDGDQAAYDECHQNYAAFITEPNLSLDRLGFFDEGDESEYVQPATFDHRRFYDDLKKYVKSEVGKGVTVTFQEGCSEFEIYRTK